MNRASRFVFAVALGTLIIASLASAQGERGEKYYKERIAYWNDVIITTDSCCVDSPWVPPLHSFPYTIPANQSVWIYGHNTYFGPYLKNIALVLIGSDSLSDRLKFDSAKGYYNDCVEVDTVIDWGEHTLGYLVGVEFWVEFSPQPDCEWIKITNITDKPTQITSAYIKAHCGVPTLTNYGLIVLLGLLILSAIYVIYHNRKGVARA